MSSNTLGVPTSWVASLLRKTTGWQNIDNEEVKAHMMNVVLGYSPSPFMYASNQVRMWISNAMLLRTEKNWEQFNFAVGLLAECLEEVFEERMAFIRSIRTPQFTEKPNRPPTELEIEQGVTVDGWTATYTGWM